MNESPLVSVLMPTYNAEKYLGQAIESVIASNYNNWELIIVDDKSKDKSLAIAKSYQELDHRIKVYENEINLGDYPNRNKTASYASGKYLKYLDNDDIIYRYSLSYMVEAMERFGDAGLGLGYIMVDDDQPYPIYKTSKEAYRYEFLENSILNYGPSASILKREAFESVGGFSGKPFVGDHELWLRIALKYPVVKLQPSLIWYRVHPNQESVRERKNFINRNVRFNCALEALHNGKHFFSDEEFKFCEYRIKRNYSRTILREIFVNKDLKLGIKAWKISKLSFTELLQGFKSYI